MLNINFPCQNNIVFRFWSINMIKYKQPWSEAIGNPETDYVSKRKPNLLIRLGELWDASSRK